MMNVAFQWSKKMQPKGFLKNIVICNMINGTHPRYR